MCLIERMRRSGIHNNGHPGGPSEFHLDMPQMPMWQNGPMHVQILPSNIGIDPLMNNSPGDQLDRSYFTNKTKNKRLFFCFRICVSS